MLVLAVINPLAYAAQSSSSGYQVNEVFMGSGGELNSCSASYCSKQSAGEVATGNTASNAFRAQAGFNTDREPYLAFSVAGTNANLGVLSPFGTATLSTTFAVKTYLASGYVVKITADAPANVGNGHLLSPLATPSSSAPGTEQFGINLVNNTTGCGSPVNMGADPVQVPDNTFSYGVVATGYDTCGLFKYVKGDTIASSPKSSGETDYSMSFIYNISNITPDGDYIFNGSIVATSTY